MRLNCLCQLAHRGGLRPQALAHLHRTEGEIDTIRQVPTNTVQDCAWARFWHGSGNGINSGMGNERSEASAADGNRIIIVACRLGGESQLHPPSPFEFNQQCGPIAWGVDVPNRHRKKKNGGLHFTTRAQ